MLISKKAFDLIVDEETGGKAFYNAREMHTDWPGGASGVTIGCGYDLGYATKAQIISDWGDKVRPDMLMELEECAGINGPPAHSLAHELFSKVLIPWEVALDVFTNRDVPKWEKITQQHLPNTDKLSGDSFGALVSLSFNRGPSYDNPGDRYTEMRNIKDHMERENFAAIPHEFRSMKRIWPLSADLRNRREHEAQLFEGGLTAIV